jgi:hypothetical protein
MNRSKSLLAASIAAGAAVAYGAYVAMRKRGWLLGRPGSQTNASEAMDDFAQEAHATHEEQIDTGVAQTFPASDPVAVGRPSQTAHEQESLGVPKERDLTRDRPRSPDWLLQR